MKLLIATIPSPPGRFSTTTGWPQRAESLSAIRRAPMSAPEPGPSVRINLTVRCGQVCAATGAIENASASSDAAATPSLVFMLVIVPSKVLLAQGLR